MWFHGVVLLAATALFSSVNCKATGLTKVNTPKTPVIAPLLSAEAPTQRMLRIDVNSEDGDEARFIDFNKMLNEGRTPSYVLGEINAFRRVHDLEDGMVRRLDKYVAKYNRKHKPEEVESTFGTLKAHYNDEEIAVMIQRGIVSSNPNTKALAEKLSDAQFSNWLRDNQSPVDIFRTLDLESTGYAAFLVMRTDAYQAFQRYLVSYNREWNAEVTEFQVFQAIYGGRDLALMIQHALPTGSEAVKNMENAQFRNWDILDPAVVDEDDVIMRYEDVRYEVFNDSPTPDEEEILERYMDFLRDEYGISRG